MEMESNWVPASQLLGRGEEYGEREEGKNNDRMCPETLGRTDRGARQWWVSRS